MDNVFKQNYLVNLKNRLVTLFGEENPASNTDVYLVLKEINITEIKIDVPKIKNNFYDNKNYKIFTTSNTEDETVIVFNLKKIKKEPAIFQYPINGLFGSGLRVMLISPEDKISQSANIMQNSAEFKNLNKGFFKILILNNLNLHKAYVGYFNLDDEQTNDFLKKVKNNENINENYIIESAIGSDVQFIIESNKTLAEDQRLIIRKNWFSNSKLIFENTYYNFNLLKKEKLKINTTNKIINEEIELFNNFDNFNSFYQHYKDLAVKNYVQFWKLNLILSEMLNDKKNDNLGSVFIDYYNLLYTFQVLLKKDPDLSDGGLSIPYVDIKNMRIEKVEIDYSKMSISEADCFWKQGTDVIQWNLGNLINNHDVPARTEADLNSWDNFTPFEDVNILLSKSKEILLEAVALKKYTIPYGAVLDFKIGPFVKAHIFEIMKDVYFVFKTEDDHFQIESICPSDQTYTQFLPFDYDDELKKINLKIEDEKDNDIREAKFLNYKKEIDKKYLPYRASWIFLCCSILRDFYVVEEREKVFSQRVNNLNRKRNIPNNNEPRIVYVPRIKYLYSDNLKQEKNKIKSAEKSAHFVQAHLRKVNNPSQYQIELAKNYGFTNIPSGHTFVSPHYAGTAVREVIYRSRSLLQHYFREDLSIEYNNKSDWFKFEKDISNLFKNLGFKVDHVGPTDQDGIDIMATKSKEEYLIQAKCWKNPVGPDVVRELIGSLDLVGVNAKGILVTTSRFTNKAIRDAERSSRDIQLIGGTELYKILESI